MTEQEHDIDADFDEATENEQAPALPPAEEVRLWLETLFGHLGLEGQLQVRESDDQLEVTFNGPGAEHLIADMAANGPGVLHALQTAAQSAVSSGNRRRYGVSIDPEGFRQGRVDHLQGISTALGDKVVAIGQSITVFGMSSFDRRAVHTGLRDNRGIRTESEGFGPFRRLKISPR